MTNEEIKKMIAEGKEFSFGSIEIESLISYKYKMEYINSVTKKMNEIVADCMKGSIKNDDEIITKLADLQRKATARLREYNRLMLEEIKLRGLHILAIYITKKRSENEQQPGDIVAGMKEYWENLAREINGK